MSALDGLVFTAVAIEASPGWATQLHSVRRRVFGPGDACTTEALVGPETGVVSSGTATLITEQGDTLIFQSNVTADQSKHVARSIVHEIVFAALASASIAGSTTPSAAAVTATPLALPAE